MADWVVVSGILAAATALITALSARKKAEADASSTLAASAVKMVEGIRVELDQVRAENSSLRSEVQALRVRIDAVEWENEQQKAGISILCNQLVALGHRPNWRPQGERREGV